ncbi:unnamed protein product, partial [Didymodactylos carnosus]
STRKVRKALNLCKKILPDMHLDVATIYNDISQIYYDQGDYGKAIEYWTKTFEIQKALLSPNHPDVARTCNSLSEAFYKDGALELALALRGKSYVIDSNNLPDDRPHVLNGVLWMRNMEKEHPACNIFRILRPSAPDSSSTSASTEREECCIT